MSTKKQEAIGLRVMAQVVRETWGSRWQEFDSINDDGIDGMIQICRRNQPTGALVFVQVKCGVGYRQDTKVRGGHIGIQVGQKYIETHRPRWRKLQGPAVLVYVDPSTDPVNPDAWWTDLNDESTYTPDNRSIILVPKRQTFGLHTKGHFRRLCSAGPANRLLPTIRLSREDVNTCRFSQTLKVDARLRYKAWSAAPAEERTNPALGPITVSRVGWRHICRRGRKPERIVQSWLLLGAAQAIIRQVSQWDRLGRTVTRELERERTILDYVGARAWVEFPHRRSGVVQVVLKRVRTFDVHTGSVQSKVFFFSVYEQNERDAS